MAMFELRGNGASLRVASTDKVIISEDQETPPRDSSAADGGAAAATPAVHSRTCLAGSLLACASSNIKIKLLSNERHIPNSIDGLMFFIMPIFMLSLFCCSSSCDFSARWLVREQEP